MMFVKDNTNMIFVVGYLIISNVWLAVGNFLLFGVWTILALIIFFMDMKMASNELKRIERRIRFINSLERDLRKNRIKIHKRRKRIKKRRR